MPPAVLMLGLLIASPTLKAAFLDGTMPVDVALRRVLVILIVTAIAWVAMRSLVQGYGEPSAPFPELKRLGEHEGDASAQPGGAGADGGVGAPGLRRAGDQDEPRRRDNAKGDRRSSDR